MLTYSVNGNLLHLQEGASVRVTWANPACNFGQIPGDIGVGVDIPANEHNRTILGNPERFSKYAAGSDRKISGFEIRYNGVLLISGRLVIQNASSESYSGWVQSNLGVLGEEQQEKNITELSWPEDQIFDYNDGDPYTDDDNDYNVTVIKNPGFWDGIGKEVPNPDYYPDVDGFDTQRPEKISQMRLTHKNNYQWYVNNHTLPTVIDGLVVSPFLFLRYVIKESLRLNKWFIGRNDMVPDPDLGLDMWKNLSVYNNYNIIDMSATTTATEDNTFDYDRYGIVEVQFNEITSYAWSLKPFDYKKLLPKIKLGEMLLGLQNHLNFVFRFRNDQRVDIIDRNAILSSTATDLDQWHVDTWEIGERKDVTLKFVSEFDEDDLEFASNYEDLTDRRADFGASVATFTDLAGIASPRLGELRLVRDENKIYEYKWSAISLEDVNFFEVQKDRIDWVFVSTGPQPYLYGTAEEIEEIKTPVSTLRMRFDSYMINNVPYTHQKGNLGSTPSVYNDFTFRLITGNNMLWPEGLFWEGDYGLFKTRWEKWARFWKNRLSVTAQFNLPLNMISYLIDNITGKYRTQEGEFIIEEMECEFGMNAIGKTTIKGFKI